MAISSNWVSTGTTLATHHSPLEKMKIPESCFECDEGRYKVVSHAYEQRGIDGVIVVVPDVQFLRCSNCGDEIIPAESDRYISRFVAEANEQLSKAELFAMLVQSGLNQKEFAEAIGLGEKTFHRWLKGTQVASRSMGYYLRVLNRFPNVFGWVKDRKWRETAPRVAKADCKERFPALAEQGAAPRRPTRNPARGLSEVRMTLAIH
jgi:DNA-binding transcriptional regulator YiaG